MPPDEKDAKAQETETPKGTTPETPPQEGAPKTPTMEDVVGAMRFLAQQNKELRAEIEKVKSTPPPPVKVELKTPEKPVDIETLSREEFANLIVGRVREEVLKPIESRFSESEERNTTREVERQVKQASEENPDFWEWQDEMQGVLKQHPELTIHEAYVLAKTTNQTKAAKLEEKKKAEEDTKRTSERERERKELFGGLLPTSGGTTRSKRMDRQTAAEKAWDDSGIGKHLAAISDN